MRTFLFGSLAVAALAVSTLAPRDALAQAPAQAPAAQPAAPNTTAPAPAPGPQVAPAPSGTTPAPPAAGGPPAAAGAAPTAPADRRPISQAEVDNWDSSQPIPAGYHSDSKHSVGLIVGGILITGAMWGATVLGAIIYHAGDSFVSNVDSAVTGNKPSQTSVTPLYIPVAGPFVQVATTGGAFTGKAVLILDGLVQAGGAAMFIYGIVAPKEYLVRDASKSHLPNVMFAPIVTQEQRGLGVVGRF